MDDLPRLPIRPYGPLLLVMRDSPFKKRGLLFVPDTAQAVKHSGTVLDIGCGIYRPDGSLRPHDVRRGDWIFWMRFAERGQEEFGRLGQFEVVVDNEKRDVLLIDAATVLGMDRSGSRTLFDDIVFVRRVAGPETTPGGLAIPDIARRPLNEGVIVAAGLGPWDDDQRARLPMPEVGMHVYWDDFRTEQHEATSRFTDGEDIIWLTRNAILGHRGPDGSFIPMGNMLGVVRKKTTHANGSVLVPDTVNVVEEEGTVVSIGSWGDRDEGPAGYAVGDTVFWDARYTDLRDCLQSFAPADHEFMLLRRDEPLCVKERA